MNVAIVLLLQTYGPPGSAVGSECILCSNSSAVFSFEWQLNNDIFQAQAVSVLNADNFSDCLAEYQQIVDGAW